MGIARLIALGAVVLILSSCASASREVPVLGDPGKVAVLVGEWRGEYTSPMTGRTGTIYFALQEGTGAAEGDVVMIRDRSTAVNWEDRVTIASARHLAEVLSIRFVRMETGLVTGRLEPYVDPDCGNVHTTTFYGEVRDGRVMTGSFVSVSDAHRLHTGGWTATRVR
ncbi:MAG TPA: hypothetical protein VMM17_07955 [Gemmatimonadaceae bacterium]|nr:hypothetical protein [Gemmatimonadaceae bacterium]